MKLLAKLSFAALSLLAVLGLTSATPSKKAIELRGKYLVVEVAKCGDCHSPRDEFGSFIPTKWLHGASIPFKPMSNLMVWAEEAPGIAGLPGWSDEEALSLFTRGCHLDGKPLRNPMPAYRLPDSDAKAIIAYLRSLTPASRP